LKELCREFGFIKRHIIFTDINNLKDEPEIFLLVWMQHFKMLTKSAFSTNCTDI